MGKDAKTFMEQALAQAQLAFSQDEVPVGAVIIHQNHVIAAAHNLTRQIFDPTAHAEICAIRAACQILHRERLVDCDLYVTLEPCAMCAAAISFARIRRLYYATADEKGGAVENEPRFFTQPTCHHVPEIYSGLCARESARLLKRFFAHKRTLTLSSSGSGEDQAADKGLQPR